MEGLDHLRRLVGPERVFVGAEIPPLYLRDMLTPSRAFAMPPDGWSPAAVVRPESTESVSAILRAAGEHGWKVVCWGGGTNLMGAAAAVNGEVILDLRQMNRILEVNAPDRRIRVQPGATLQAVEDAAEREGLVLGHDPWTRGQATVGGSISLDGLGYLAARYGSMGQMVLGLTMVLGDGTVVTTRAAQRPLGFDTARLAVGTEGTLGVITEAVLKLRPRPERQAIVAYRVPDFAAGFRAASALVEIGPAILDFNESFPEGARYMPREDPDGEPMLCSGFEGASGVVEAQIEAAGRAVAAQGGRTCGADVARGYWAQRHAIADLVARGEDGRSAGDDPFQDLRFDYLHLVLPLGRVLEFRGRAIELLKARRILPVGDGLWMHPELYSLYFLRPRQSDAEDTREMAEAIDEAVRRCHALGGVMEYCHGVGLRLARHLPEELGVGLQVYERIKSALDPRGVLPRLGRGATG